ncbi:MAG: type II CAAX endopeptidase family protein [Candidatus Bathyarchaeia archaeon]
MLFAAYRRGAYAYGIEVRPVLYEGVRKMASDMGFEDRLFLRLGDLYLNASDLIGKADVLYAFLDEEGCRLLKPRLEASLKPGARIVTLSYRIPGWKPLKSLKVGDPESRSVRFRRLYLYVFGKHLPSEAFRTFLTAFATLASFAPLYAFLLEAFGYTYGLHVASSMAFAALGAFMALIPFPDAPSVLNQNQNQIHNQVRNQVPPFQREYAFLRLRLRLRPRMRTRLLLAFLTLLILSEELLLNSPLALYGMALSIAGFIGLPVLGIIADRSFGSEGWLQKALEALSLIMATRVVLTPFPMGFLELTVLLPVVYTLILAGLTLYLSFRRIEAEALRLSLGKKSLKSQAFLGLASGSFVGLAEFFVLKPSPILKGAPIAETIAYVALVMAVMVGFVEELLFRGLFQASLERLLPPWQAIGMASVVFGLMHLGWMNPLEVLLAYGAGVLFGYLARATDSLLAPMVAHGFGNIVLYLVAMA